MRIFSSGNHQWCIQSAWATCASICTLYLNVFFVLQFQEIKHFLQDANHVFIKVHGIPAVVWILWNVPWSGGKTGWWPRCRSRRAGFAAVWPHLCLPWPWVFCHLRKHALTGIAINSCLHHGVGHLVWVVYRAQTGFHAHVHVCKTPYKQHAVDQSTQLWKYPSQAFLKSLSSWKKNVA